MSDSREAKAVEIPFPVKAPMKAFLVPASPSAPNARPEYFLQISKTGAPSRTPRQGVGFVGGRLK